MLRELEKRLEKEPDNLSLRVTVAGLMSEAGRKAEAVELYRSVAIAYRDQGRALQAIAVCKSILELAPDDMAIHALLAELQQPQAGEPRRARTPSAAEPTVTSVRPPPEPPAGTTTLKGHSASGGAAGEDARKMVPPKTTTPPAGVRPLVPSPAGARPPSRPPASSRTPPVAEPPVIPGAPRRSVGEVDTPLPKAVPYHVADPTTAPAKVPPEEIDDLPLAEGAETNPGRDPSERKNMAGLAQAARRISGLIAQDLPGRDSDVDLSAELETRQVIRVSADELEKVAGPPPTGPVDLVDDHDLPTPPPPRTWGKPFGGGAVPIRDTPADPPTGPDHVAAPARDTDDELTSPRELVAADPLANAFFVALPANKRESALARCTPRPARAGSTVIRQGETSHPLILVVTGKLELRVERVNGTLAMVDTIDAGQYIGEAALLGRMPAPANVIAATDCELLALPPHALFELAGAYPALWAALKDTAERRTRAYDKAIRGAP